MIGLGDPASRQSAGRQDGFTLIEVIVSLMLLTLILSFIPGTLRIGQRVWETDDDFERRAALSTFRRYVQQRLAEAIPIHLRERGTLRIEFIGEADRVAFVAPANAGPAGGGVYRFDFRRAEGEQASRPLILRQSLYRITAASGPDPAVPIPAIEHESAIRVAGLSFRYFGAPNAGEPGRWLAQWPRQDSLPDLVEISLTVGGRIARAERVVVPLRLKRAS
jgi:prepilin-type N-terminal cleavage/methylation domain-containing protein